MSSQSLNEIKTSVALDLLGLAAKIGISTLVGVLKTRQENTITLKDLEELGNKSKNPEDYFNG